jgi:hypothetical protein
MWEGIKIFFRKIEIYQKLPSFFAENQGAF